MPNSTTSILVPIILTGQTVEVLDQACSLARHTHSKIVLLAVNENENSFTLKKKLTALALEANEKSGCPVETLIRKGDVYKQIKKVADVFNSLLIIGITGKFSFGGAIGNNEFKFVREFKNPVFAIRGKATRNEYKTILLPLQLRKETREKVDKAIELAKQYDASIRIASVITQLDEDSENRLLAYSNQVWRYIKSYKIRCTLKTLRGKNPVPLVMDYAHQVDADVILIINKEPINIKEFFMGTFTQHLMSESDIPVMCYQPMERRNVSMFLPY